MASSAGFLTRIARRITGGEARARTAKEQLRAEKLARLEAKGKQRSGGSGQPQAEYVRRTNDYANGKAANNERSPGGAISFSEMSPAARLRLIDETVWLEPLNVEGADLNFEVRSKTEYSRVSRVKETWTVEWVAKLPEDAVLWDIGANIGIFSLLAAKRPEVKSVVAVEPSFLNYASLVKNVANNGLGEKVIPVAAGLGDRTGFFPLKMENLVPGGSLHSFGDIFKVSQSRNVDGVATVLCQCFRIDDLAAIEGIPAPSHFKIDVDGFELEVLKGGEQTLKKESVRGMQVEVMDHDAELPRRKALTELVESYGFTLSAVITHGNDTTQVADMHFVRP